MLRIFGYDRNYYIGISGDEKYTLVYDHLDEDVPTTKIVDWKRSDAIKQGPGTNRLKEALIGDTIELYVTTDCSKLSGMTA